VSRNPLGKSRFETTNFLSMHGASVQAAVIGRTDFVLTSASEAQSSRPSTKVKKARDKGIPVITPEEFHAALDDAAAFSRLLTSKRSALTPPDSSPPLHRVNISLGVCVERLLSTAF